MKMTKAAVARRRQMLAFRAPSMDHWPAGAIVRRLPDPRTVKANNPGAPKWWKQGRVA